MNLLMQMNEGEKNKRWLHRLWFFVFFLMCGFFVFIFENFLTNDILPIYFICISVIFFVFSSYVRRNDRFKNYFPVFFAFFIASFVSFLDNLATLFGWFSNSTVEDAILGILVSTILIVIPIILLTKISGFELSSLYLQKGKLWIGLGIGLGIFFFLLAITLINPHGASSLFPVNSNLTNVQAISLMPWVVIFVLLNGLREEVWFRGLFLKKYGNFLGNKGANFLQAVIFSLAHISVQYTPTLLVFLVITFLLGFIWGFLTQKTNSLLAAIFFHAAMDIVIVLGIFSNF
jgi:membrane protease YdiL (CAAX protease family)